MKASLFVGVLAVAFAGCAETFVVRPTQLAVFNDEIKTNSGVQKILRFETVEGRMVELNPPAAVTITMSDGSKHEFCSPLRADFDAGFLSLHHACGRPARLEGQQISKVEVQEW